MCKKVSGRCNGYDKDTGSCIGCVDGFVASRGKCLDSNCVKESSTEADKCEVCKDGFAFKNGLCRFDDVNCQVIMKDSCSQCFDGYVFSSAKNKCIVTP